MDEKELFKKYFEITKEKTFIVKPGKYVEVRISDSYFENGVSAIIGDCIETFGFLDIYAWDEYHEGLKDNDAKKIFLRLPTIITTKPTRIEHNSKNKETILEYFENSLFITSTYYQKVSSVVIDYVKLILSGKIPDDIPYNEIVSYLEKCTTLNKVNLKVNSLFVDIIVMMVSRDPNNLSRQFREVLKENPRASMLSRKLVNIDIIPSLTSQFDAIVGGNPKYGITSSIGAVKSGDLVPVESEIERAIK
jgi:hypothetical protein